MILNKSNNAVTITNFCLGKHLINDDDLLKDQRGSPAYISPEVLSGKYAVSHRWEFVFAGVYFIHLPWNLFGHFGNLRQQI